MEAKAQTAQLWICTSCGFIYDPEEGDPDGGIPPGTPFESIPDDWFCPVCGARKADFEPYEEYAPRLLQRVFGDVLGGRAISQQACDVGIHVVAASPVELLELHVHVAGRLGR